MPQRASTMSYAYVQSTVTIGLNALLGGVCRSSASCPKLEGLVIADCPHPGYAVQFLLHENPPLSVLDAWRSVTKNCAVCPVVLFDWPQFLDVRSQEVSAFRLGSILVGTCQWLVVVG